MNKKIYLSLFFLISYLVFCTQNTLAAAIVSQIDIQGIHGEILENVQQRIALEKKKFESDAQATTSTFIHEFPQIMTEAIQPFGYFSPKIKLTTTSVDKQAQFHYFINLGQPVRIQHIKVVVRGPGSSNLKILKYLSQLPLKKGDIFAVPQYNILKEKLFNLANEQGYIEAFMQEARIIIDKKNLSATLFIDFNTGECFYWGPLIFNPNPYAPQFLSGFNIFNQDQPFSSTRLMNYQQELNNSRYFSQALVIPDLKQKMDNHIPIHVNIIPPKARKYSLGLGYGSFTGPRLTAGVNFNRVTNTGQSLNVQFKLSSVLSGIAAKYYIPGKNPLTDQWMLGFNHERLKPKNGDSTSDSLLLGYSKKIKSWQLITNLNYLIENYTILGLPAHSSVLLYPSINLAYNKADDVINPHFGKMVNLTLQGASQHFFSSTSFLQADLKAKYFTTPFSFAHVILRGELGYTIVHDLNDLPLTMRFLAGGLTSVRGYPNSSIGPGKFLEVASIEYQNHLTENWLAAVFYDIGTATNNFGTPLNVGTGVGIVYESAIGPIRLYLASARSKPGHPYQIEFSMGSDF